jgi:hypothetical protein
MAGRAGDIAGSPKYRRDSASDAGGIPRRSVEVKHPGGLRILDPVAVAAQAPARTPRKIVPTLRGARIGFVWGQHVSTVAFWPRLEQAIEALYAPSTVVRLYKPSTWNPAPRETLADLLTRVDVAIAGVGG